MVRQQDAVLDDWLVVLRWNQPPLRFINAVTHLRQGNKPRGHVATINELE